MANLKTGASRKQSTPNFPKNKNLMCSFPETPVSRFAFLPYYRRINLFQANAPTLYHLKTPENQMFSKVL